MSEADELIAKLKRMAQQIGTVFIPDKQKTAAYRAAHKQTATEKKS